MKFHHWKKYEDEIVCACVLANRTDDKTIKKLSVMLGIDESKVAFRMTNFCKLRNNHKTDWHCSKQELRVFWGLKLI